MSEPGVDVAEPETREIPETSNDTEENKSLVVNEDAVIPEEDTVYPGEDDGDQKEKEKDVHKWHDFETQYSVALEHSVMVEREQWGGDCEFLMSCIASAVGLGNIWRFPLIAGQNGGGAFLIPYLVVLTLIGRPLYMMELGLGQFCSNGPVKIWEMVPALRGVGMAAAIASFFVSTFYCAIMGWALLYLFYSFLKVFPWDENQKVTYSGISINPEGSPEIFFQKLHLGVPDKFHNKTDFWNEKGLDGAPVLNLAIALFVSWFLVWIVMVRGVSGSGKIAYFTALFPYFVLVILLGGGLSLPGAGTGIRYFYEPTWKKILLPQTWFQAVGQCFFSLGISFGGCIMFSSFNSFHHKLGRDILVISIMDTFTSLLAGTCLFALIGNIAETTNKTIEDLTMNPGAGLAFITFPSVLKAFGDYPGPNCISGLFFLMIIVLALGSANGLVGTTVTVTCDYFPKWKRPIVVTVMCSICFLLGLTYICPTGNYVIDIVDKHGSELVVYVVAICEIIGIVAIYGLKNISNDFEFMLGTRVNWYWMGCWAILPFLLFIIFLSYLATYERDKKWPNLASNCAWALTAICWSILPIVATVVIQTRKSHSFANRFKAAFLPTRKWGPKDLCVREAWRRWKKTKPTEFKCTGQVLVALGIRKPSDSDPNAFWLDEDKSNYQTTSNSSAESQVAIESSVGIASENALLPTPQPQP